MAIDIPFVITQEPTNWRAYDCPDCGHRQWMREEVAQLVGHITYCLACGKGNSKADTSEKGLVAGTRVGTLPAPEPPKPPGLIFDDYQKKAHKTAIYPDEEAVVYTALGLASEAGEYAGLVKKWIRDGLLPDREKAAAELGDALWYVAECATALGLSLDDIAKANLAKLASRKDRGVLSGSGDER